MKYRSYPNTDLTVSEVGLGMWTLSTGWWGEVNDEKAIALVQKALDTYGVTFFDAADTYGNGRSEEQLGKAFANRRQDVVIATKFGYDIYDTPQESRGQRELPHRTDPEFIRYACEQSLKRLQTDYIDLYQLHNARMNHIDEDGIFETLEALKQEGKIRHYGVALGPANGWLFEGLRSIRERRVTSLQVIYNLLEQHPGLSFVKEAALEGNETGLLIRVPHSSGMLEGHYTVDTTFEKTDHRSHRPKQWLINGVQKVEQLRFLERDNRTMGQMALKYLLSFPQTTSTLPNIYDEAQLKEFATTSEAPDLTRDELAKIEALVATNFGIDEPINHEAMKGTMTVPQTWWQTPIGRKTPVGV